jgi:hypothetical protein
LAGRSFCFAFRPRKNGVGLEHTAKELSIYAAEGPISRNRLINIPFVMGIRDNGDFA